MVTKQLSKVYQRVFSVGSGAISILSLAIQRFAASGSPQAAAGMAYYAFFSLFPLLLVIIVIGSFAITTDAARKQVFEILSNVIPVPVLILEENIAQVLELRGTVGLVALVGLIWSASSVFTVLVRQINAAWPDSTPRGVLERYVYGIGIFLVVIVLFALWFVSNTVFDLLPRFDLPIQVDIEVMGSPISGLILELLPLLSTFLMFLLLYRWVPNYPVRYYDAFWGALVAAIAWDLSTNLFSWYVSSGLANYRLVYGSLWAILALMFWIYLSCMIVLMGAHLSASVSDGRGNSS